MTGPKLNEKSFVAGERAGTKASAKYVHMSAWKVRVVLDLIRTLKAQRDRTILLVEHKMDVVRELADRIVVLHQGQLVADGDPATVMKSAVVQEAYLGRAKEAA